MDKAKRVTADKRFRMKNDEKDSADILAASIAYGLGINNKEVDLVINYGMAKSLEEYIQMIGRAGRGVGTGNAVLIYKKYSPKCKYYIIFMDHMMPGMDGIEAFHKMREDTLGPNIDTPVVALTANAISGSREFYLEAGFNDYLSKPINAEQLEKMIYGMLPEELIEQFAGKE